MIKEWEGGSPPVKTRKEKALYAISRWREEQENKFNTFDKKTITAYAIKNQVFF